MSLVKLENIFAMKTLPAEITSHCRRAMTLAVCVGLVSLAVPVLRAAEAAKTFAAPEEAVVALRAAMNNTDNKSLRALFGSAADDFIGSDDVQARNDQTAFAAAMNATNRLVHESDSRCVLEVGTNSWPFPVPIVRKEGRWYFDGAAGKDEVVNRRIGNNELATLQTLRASVQAQREYAAQDRDGDEVLEFAQKFTSSSGQKDGLFWEPELDGSISPLGPLVAAAQAEGYDGVGGIKNPPQPYHGYNFKILTRQGKNVPGGKYDYMINGNMIGGFAFVAWPANYGESGIMTFIVNQQGKVYQKDLGPKTAKLAAAMKSYDLDPTWTLSKD